MRGEYRYLWARQVTWSFVRPHPAGPRHGDVQPPAGAPRRPDDSILDLDPTLWPRHARRNADGAIEVAGHDVRVLAEQFGTPLLVMDADDTRSRMREYATEFASDEMPATVYYAAKAFLSTTFAQWVAEAGLGIDVCTLGELECALAVDFPVERILFHGNNKSTMELRRALQAQVGLIVVDSFEEIARVGFLCDELDTSARVLVRVTVGVEAHTHEFIATAHEDQKFGFSLASGDALEAVTRVHAMPRVEFAGLHSHIGSQIFVASGFEVAAHRVVQFADQLRSELDVRVEILNLGGGLGIKYTPDDEPLEPAEMAGRIRRIVATECGRQGLPVPHLAFEPGRAIVGPSGITVYSVGTVKPVELDGGSYRTYVSVDGGMSDNIRTALYGAEYTTTLASRVSQSELILTRVVGKHCESGDIVVSDAWLPADVVGTDLLAVAATGAYNRSMASNYNLVPRPAVVAVTESEQTVLLRREELADVFACDPGFAEPPH